jgi:hypothetical protein
MFIIYSDRYSGFYGESGVVGGGSWFQAGSRFIQVFAPASEKAQLILERNIDLGLQIVKI